MKWREKQNDVKLYYYTCKSRFKSCYNLERVAGIEPRYHVGSTLKTLLLQKHFAQISPKYFQKRATKALLFFAYFSLIELLISISLLIETLYEKTNKKIVIMITDNNIIKDIDFNLS